MCYLLADWTPSKAAIDLIRLNEIDENQIKASVEYLRNQTELKSLDDLTGYDNWNSFFIIFCIKAHRKPAE